MAHSKAIYLKPQPVGVPIKTLLKVFMAKQGLIEIWRSISSPLNPLQILAVFLEIFFQISHSNIASSIAEDVHMIRDLKVQLYEKKTPTVISTLRIVPLFFIILLITVIITQYVRKNQINTDYQNGLDVTHYGYWRHDLLAEINLKFRYLQLMARNMITYDGTTQAAYEANLHSQVFLFHYRSL